MQPEPVPMSAIEQSFAGHVLLRAGAEIAQRETIERDFDDVFGFRARNQNVWSDFKFEAPEFLFAGEMLYGNSAARRSISEK